MLQTLQGNGQSFTAYSATCIEDITLRANRVNALEAQLRAPSAPRRTHHPSSSTTHPTPPETQRSGGIRHPVTVSQEYNWVEPWQHPLASDHAVSVPCAQNSCPSRADTGAQATGIVELSAAEVEQMRTELASLRIALAQHDVWCAVNADEPLPTYSEQ